jgi:hypothetical protein
MIKTYRHLPSIQYAEDYRFSANKHIVSCDFILKNLKNGVDVDSFVVDNLLRNVYYLSGYIIECSINYNIYKRLKWTKPVFTFYNREYNVSFRDNTRYVIKNHDFHSNMELLDLLIPGNKILEIPIISGELLGFSEKSRKLFFSWNPAIRYETQKGNEPFYLLDELLEFVHLAKEIYIKLLQS